MKKIYIVVCALFVISLSFSLSACTDNNGGQTDSSAPTLSETKDTYPSRENSYPEDFLKKKDFKCDISWSSDSYAAITTVEGKTALELYNLMNQAGWTLFDYRTSKESAKDVVLLNFYDKEYYHDDNCYGFVYIAENDIVAHTHSPMDMELTTYKAPDGTFAQIKQYILGH